MARIEKPAAMARETSSRSASVNANGERRRCGGRMPPVWDRILYRRVRPIEQLSNLMEGPAFLPSLPHQGLLAVGVVGSRPVLHLQHSFCQWQSSVSCIDRLNPQKINGIRASSRLTEQGCRRRSRSDGNPPLTQTHRLLSIAPPGITTRVGTVTSIRGGHEVSASMEE